MPMDTLDSSKPITYEKLGLTQKGHRLVIVAEAKTTEGTLVWIEAIPVFNAQQTVVELEFWMHAQKADQKSKHVSITPGVVEQALLAQTSPCAAAMLDQYGWLEQNFPEISSVIYKSHQSRLIPPQQPQHGAADRWAQPGGPI